MESILGSWGRVFRFLFLVMLLLLLGSLTINHLLDSNQIDVSIGEKTSMSVIKTGGLVNATSVLAASDCWENTGIEIWPGEEIELKVTGKVHTAIDHLTKNAMNDEPSRYKWSDYNGTNFVSNNKPENIEYDLARKSMMIDSSNNFGAVLFYLQVGDTGKPPSCNDGAGFNPRPGSSKLEKKDRGYYYFNDSDKIIYLWASVNDMLLVDFSNTAKKAFLGKPLKGKELIEKEKQWEVLKKSRYRTLWFEDNIGAFIITANIKRRKGFFGNYFNRAHL